MTILPREQVTQRHLRSAVSAPGVRLWSSSTLYLPTDGADVTITDSVTAGDVALATQDPIFPVLDVETIANSPLDVAGNIRGIAYDEGYYGEGEYGGLGDDWDSRPDYPGIYQATEYGDGGYGDGVYGGLDLEYHVEQPDYGYAMKGP